MRPNKQRMAFKMAAHDNEDVTDLYIDGVIGVDIDWNTWEEIRDNTIEEFRKKLADINTSKIRVWINSGGGDARHGISIHDALKEHPAEVTTITSGFTASAATIIAQAGDIRLMSEFSLYLVHKCMGFAFGWFNEDDLEIMLNDNRAIDDLAIKVYTSHEGSPSEEEIRNLMNKGSGRGVWLSAEETLERGLIDEIYVPGEFETEPENMDQPDEEAENTAQQQVINEAEKIIKNDAAEENEDTQTPEDKEAAKELLSEAARMEELGLPPVPEAKTKQLLEVQAAGRKRKAQLHKIKTELS